jgi:hypothetical protein
MHYGYLRYGQVMVSVDGILKSLRDFPDQSSRLGI